MRYDPQGSFLNASTGEVAFGTPLSVGAWFWLPRVRADFHWSNGTRDYRRGASTAAAIALPASEHFASPPRS
jgi:hypothetical protein